MFGNARIKIGRPSIPVGSLLLLGVLMGNVQSVFADEFTPSPARPDLPPAVNLFLNTPDDLGALWKALERPDFVLLKGDEYERLRRSADREQKADGWASVANSVLVRGKVEGELAELTVEIGLTVTGQGPIWAPIGLDGLSLTEARAAGQPLPLRVGAEGAWEVEVRGMGSVEVSASLVVPVRSTPEGRRVDLSIPEAATTRFALEVKRRVTEAIIEPSGPLAIQPDKNGLTLLAAVITPRPRLSLLWREAAEAATTLPPLLVAHGEIAVEIDSGSLRTRSSWAIRSLRGSSRSLQFRLDPDEEVRELELDGQTPPAGLERAGEATILTIPLTEPLGPGQERRLVMTTKRAIPVGPQAQISFDGFPLTDAREQTGAIGISKGSQLWVSATTGRGLRQIDPRTELPAELRARPGIELAYQFSEQPFELSMKVEPAVPLVTVEGRTMVTVGPARARTETWFDYQTGRGRPFEVVLSLPTGSEVESIGPDDVVGAWRAGVLPVASTAGGSEEGRRSLTVRLGPKTQEGGRFSLRVVTRQQIEPGEPVNIGLPQPVGSLADGGRIAVWVEPSLGLELIEASNEVADPFRPMLQAPPADWPKPEGLETGVPPALWLRYDDGPASIPVKLVRHAPSLSHATSLVARIDETGADVQQEIECAIRFGATTHLDLEVPEAIQGGWEIESPLGATRTTLESTAKGGSIVRLSLSGELNRSTRLRLRYRVPFVSPLQTELTESLAIPWLRLLGSSGATAPVRALVLPEPGVTVSFVGPEWTSEAGVRAPEGAPGLDRLSGSARETEVNSLTLDAGALAFAELPSVVVPRLWLRSAQTADNQVRTIATYAVEPSARSLSVALPVNAELSRAKVGGRLVPRVEQLPERGGVKVALPEVAGSGLVFVELEFSTPFGDRASPWGLAPHLIGPAVVQQTFWEVRVPTSRAVLGTPAGWSDENEWFWDRYTWRRRPLLGGPALAAWVTGARDEGQVASKVGPDVQRYLFGRAEGPVDLPLGIVSRARLVSVCSGAVLAIGGFFIMVWRPPAPLLWGAVAGLGLAVATLVHPSLTFLALQSALVGGVLTVTIAVMQRWVDGRRGARSSPADASDHDPSAGSGSGSSRIRGDLVGSDDSTAIRSRPISTVDHHATTGPGFPASPPEPGPSTSTWPQGLGRSSGGP